MTRTRLFLSLAIVSLVFAAAPLALRAAVRPDRPSPSASTSAVFECGTAAGNERENVRLGAMNARRQKDVRNGLQSVQAATQSVYDDVWVIEDDGTLLFSGVNPFDTDVETFRFAPDGGAYDITSETFTYDAVLGSVLATGDDGSVNVGLAFAFSFGDTTWTDVHVGGNGIVSFGAIPNPGGFYDDADFFSATPKIAPFFADLNPAAGGGVFSKSEATKHTITWSAVPEYGTANLNTVQLVLRDDGSFDITFNGINTPQQVNGSPTIVGFHPGAAATLEIVSYSDDLPYTSGVGSGVYESFLNLVNPRVNEVALFQKFYQTYPDSFFQLVFFTNFTQTMSGFANELNIQNDVTGIGLGLFDFSAQYGSAGALESRCNMNRLAAWANDPTTRFFSRENNFLTIMGQEAGHRWGAFIYFEDSTSAPSNLILGRSDAHWSYFLDNDHSSLEGGDWDYVSGTQYTCPTKIDYFHALDEYLMGLRIPEEVAPTFYVGSPTNDLLANRDNGTPIQGADCFGTAVPVTIESIIAAEGARTPLEPDENKDLRQAFMLLHQNGNVPTGAELDKIATFRRAWEDYFEKSCDGRLTCNTSLTTVYPVAVIKGIVVDKLTDQPVGEFTSHSIERGFDQYVPAGSRYTFRYLADENSGAAESVTLVTEADGYYPDTCEVDLTYGTTTMKTIELYPVPTSVAVGVRIPNALYPNYPNPFNPTTTIRYDLFDAGAVTLSIYNVLGQRVRTLVSERRPAGHNEATWDGTDDHGHRVASGVYVYKLETGATVRTRKMLLLK
jgi:hypothetical protein